MQDDACKSLEEIAPGARLNAEQLTAFLKQPDSCIFMQGACHVMAAALYEEFNRRGVVVSVFEMCLDRRFQHYVVGRPDVGYTDVRLVWDPPEGFTFHLIAPEKVTDLAAALGRHRCCIEKPFLEATKARAASFIASKSTEIAAMAAWAKRGQVEGLRAFGGD